MGARWVAGVIRARAMAAGRAGPETARRLATSPGLPDALRALAGTPYRRGLDMEAGAAEAQRAVSDALVWQLRVLAGWQPRPGSAAVRLLASPFEIANTRDRLRSLTGTAQSEPYRLGALSTAWPRLSSATSAVEMRTVLATSLWGDPGADTPSAMVTGMRLSAAARTAANHPPAARWAAGEAALLVAREVHLSHRRLTEPALRNAASLLGTAALQASTFDDFRARLPATARWALDGTERSQDLWRAEAHWWAEVDREGLLMLRGTRFDVSSVVGAVAVLQADAWRIRAGLGCAAHGGRALEAFDELLG
ncbi:hypothetical protein ABZ835_43960 [Streptomyces sp. NPDC047461]|uniref:hypothetical protein n=1 Tax=Streptomyces sp. NPDC047461 TaxID=3155619 RepID=UPI0033D40998